MVIVAPRVPVRFAFTRARSVAPRSVHHARARRRRRTCQHRRTRSKAARRAWADAGRSSRRLARHARMSASRSGGTARLRPPGGAPPDELDIGGKYEPRTLVHGMVNAPGVQPARGYSEPK